LEEEAVGGRGGVEPIDVAAFVGEDLFEIANGKSFCGGASRGVGEAPEGVEVVVFGERLQEFTRSAGDYVDGAGGKIGRFEQRIKIAGDEWINFAGNGDDGVAHGESGHDGGEETEERGFGGAEDADGADGFLHG